MLVDKTELAGAASQVLQKVRKSSHYKDCGSRWLLLGDTLEKYHEKLKILSHRFKAKCQTQRASSAACGQTPHLL